MKPIVFWFDPISPFAYLAFEQLPQALAGCSYAALYRRGVAEAERYGYDFFFYVPFADVAAARDTTARHQWLGPVYSPVNELHRQWFGGRAACKCIMFGLSAEPPDG